MRRSVHIVVSLLAVLLLVRPFDCFASGAPSREAMNCCLKGNCAPTAKSDQCCRNTIPGGSDFLIFKAAGHSPLVLAVAIAPASLVVPELAVPAPLDSLAHPPPSLNLSVGNLPLLI